MICICSISKCYCCYFVFFYDKDVALAELIEAQGVPTFNSARAIRICDDKALTYAKFVEKKLSTIVDGKIRHNPQVVAMTIIEFICNELKFQDEHHGTEYLLLQSVLKEQKKIQIYMHHLGVL